MVNAAQGESDGAIASMTGYAAQEGASGSASWSWEIRSVNARGLDIRMRLPEGLGMLEAPLRKMVSARLARGAVSLTLRMARAGQGATGGLNADALDHALAAIAQIRAAAEAQGMVLSDPSPADILGLRGVADTNDAPSLPSADILLADVAPLIDAFERMRATEGGALAAVLSAQLEHIAGLIADAEAAAAARSQSQHEAFRANLAKLVEESDLDEGRLAQELAMLAVKSDVTEELDRLRAHVAAARDLLAKGGPVGRKLDFLMQEFNREANTLCSKSGDAALTAIGLDLKLAIDQTREQVQNVE